MNTAQTHAPKHQHQPLDESLRAFLATICDVTYQDARQLRAALYALQSSSPEQKAAGLSALEEKLKQAECDLEKTQEEYQQMSRYREKYQKVVDSASWRMIQAPFQASPLLKPISVGSVPPSPKT